MSDPTQAAFERLADALEGVGFVDGLSRRLAVWTVFASVRKLPHASRSGGSFINLYSRSCLDLVDAVTDLAERVEARRERMGLTP